VDRRLLLFLGMLAIGASAAQAQPSQALGVAAACSSTANETVQSLQTRRQVVEKNLEQETKRAGLKQTPALRKAQEDMLEVMFQIDCINSQQPVMQKRSVGKRSIGGGGEKPKDVVEITTYYATSRTRTGGVEPVGFYGTKPGPFHFGRAVVSIPITHKPGEIEMPSIWKLQFEADPSKHFVLRSVTPLELEAARKEMTDKIKGADSKAVLVFVHGYNSGFGDAAMRTAQLVYDLKFPGMPLFYSWPSANSVRSYLPDEETARLSESVFERLIDELSQMPITDIYIVAHSMGSRVVSHALQHRTNKGKTNKHLRELLLAAPDINADIFRNEIAPMLAAMQGLRTTVYASSSDLALRASKVVHGYQRLGETTGGVFTFPGLETIDASSASSSSRALGHSYVVDTPLVLDDIKSVIMSKASAAQRRLSAAGTAPNTYWRLPERRAN
jgi:esterase/lipase superfamily enzyme